MIHPAHEHEWAFGNEPLDQVLPGESRGSGVEVLFVFGAVCPFVVQEFLAERGEVGVD